MARSRVELDAFADLLRDFGAEGWASEDAERAFDLIADRSRGLAESYVEVADAAVAMLDVHGRPMPDVCHRLLFLAHEHLFHGITTNAGQTRQPGDRGGSRIYFGGQRGNRRTMRFEGTRAGEIGEELGHAFGRLQDWREGDREAARDAAILFYADLSRIHPFYDANGRAGRFVVSVYLHLHGWLVEWARIDEREGKFMQKINDVNEKQTAATDYEEFLLSFWKKYVVSTEGLD